jgi:hypothetical protein
MYLCILNIERAKNFGNFHVNEMPAPYSQDLRWGAIFLAEILDLELEQVCFYRPAIQLHINASSRRACDKTQEHTTTSFHHA